MIRPLPLVAMFLIAACSSPDGVPANNSSANAAQASAALLPLVIHTGAKAHRFDVEVAATPAQQEQGLMFRKTLGADTGMLFPMDPPRTASFWMKNTLIPLDMLFVRTDGTIAFVGANAQPYALEPVSAGIPVAAVLELAGGRAAALGIRQGDRVNWGACAVQGGARDTDFNFCPKP